MLARNKMDGLQELEEETKVYLQGQGVLLNASHSLSLFSPLKLRTLCVKRGQIKKSSRRTFVRTNFSNFSREKRGTKCLQGQKRPTMRRFEMLDPYFLEDAVKAEKSVDFAEMIIGGIN